MTVKFYTVTPPAPSTPELEEKIRKAQKLLDYWLHAANKDLLAGDQKGFIKCLKSANFWKKALLEYSGK